MSDPISPDYYERGGMSADRVIEAWGLTYRVGSAVAYLLRAGKKTPDPVVDIKKARRLLDLELAMYERLRGGG